MYSFSITLQYKRSPRGLTKLMREARPELFDSIALWWHREVLPKHFGNNAYERYGYQRRTKRYDQWKQRTVGHTNPMTIKGVMEREVSRSMLVSSTSRSIQGRMYASVFSLIGRKQRDVLRMYPDMRDELTRFNEKDLRDMSTYAADIFRGRLDKLRESVTVKP